MSFLGGTLAQSLCIVDALHPVSQGTGAANGAAVDMLYFNRILYVVDIGVFGASATVDFKLNSSATSNFASNVDLTGKAITQLLAGGGNNKIVKVGCTSEDLAIASTPARYVRGIINVGTAATLAQYCAYASVGRYKPEVAATSKEIAAVAQTVADAS